MGLFDRLTQAPGPLMGGKEAGLPGPLLRAAAHLLWKESSIGRLAGLRRAFQKHGLADIENSWVSTGPNLPISPAQVKQNLAGC